jgi:hypothetical protein
MFFWRIIMKRGKPEEDMATSQSFPEYQKSLGHPVTASVLIPGWNEVSGCIGRRELQNSVHSDRPDEGDGAQTASDSGS